MLYKKLSVMMAILTVSLLLSACATPTPEVIEKIVTKEVEKVVTQVVKETVKETVIVEGTPEVVEKEVTRIVEKVVIATPVPPPPEEAGEVVVVSWGGSYQDAQREAFFTPFEEETGIKVIEDTSPEHGKVKAQVDSGAPEWDVVTTGYTIFLELGPDYLEPIDYDSFAEDYAGVIEAGMTEYGVMTISYCYALGYRTDVFPEGQEPKSWADFWDVENFPGPRALGADAGVPWNSYEAALFADGVTADEIYEQPVDRAIESWDKIKDDVIKWWGSGAEGVQLLADGEVVMALVPTSRVWTLAEEGVPVAIQWNQALCGADWWWILKGAKNLENAQRFVAFASRADRQAALVSTLPYGPANVTAFESMSPDMAKWLPTAPDHVDKVFFTSSEWWGDNREEVLEKFTAWKME